MAAQVTHTLANIMRNLATILTLAAERLDPQPPVEFVRPFYIHTQAGTSAAEAHITWHHNHTNHTT